MVRLFSMSIVYLINLLGSNIWHIIKKKKEFGWKNVENNKLKLKIWKENRRQVF